jgi:hypothetical protein
MKLTRLAAIAVPAAALVAFAVPFAAHASTGHASTKNTAAKPSVAVYNCVNKPQVRPGTFDVFCDGSGYFTHLTWSNWNASMATATGVEYINNCEPNCAQGHFSHQNVDVIFWRSEPVAHHPGERGYSQMTVLYPNQKTGSHNTYTSAPPGEFPGEF